MWSEIWFDKREAIYIILGECIDVSPFLLKRVELLAGNRTEAVTGNVALKRTFP
jgi:hypothetical protein